MATLFTKIISGELPGRFVWRDEEVVAFLTIAPIRAGHTLVVPRAEVDHWIDLEPALAHRVTDVARTIGRALQHGFGSEKVGLVIAGLEVPHTHLHVLPIDAIADLDFARQQEGLPPEELDRAAETVRASLRALGLDAGADSIE